MTLPWIGYIIFSLSLTLMGLSGSLLLFPILVYLLGLDTKPALTSTLFIIGSLCLLRFLTLIKHQLFDWKLLLIFGIPSILGTYLGTIIASYNPGSMQLFFYALMLIVAAIFLIRKPGIINTQHDKLYWQLIIDGFIIGIITAFVGIGGSFLIIPALTLMGGLDLKKAITTSLIIISIKSYIGFYFYYSGQQGALIDWQVIQLCIVVGAASLALWHFYLRHFKQTLMKTCFSIALLLSATFILIAESTNTWQIN